MLNLRTFILCLLTATLIFLTQRTHSQEQKKVTLKPYGFVKFAAWFDSRQVDGARDDLMLYYPLDRKSGADGSDLNARPSLNFSAMSTRAGIRLGGPDALGAKTSALIESDYTGAGSTLSNSFRLRHAYVDLRWDNTELLIGQYWHPMFVPEVFPDLYSLNTGAPFQPFIRNPQISFRYYRGNHRLEAAMITQRDNTSDGPLGRSYVYLKNAALPNIHFQWQLKKDALVLGAAYDYKRIVPYTYTSKGYPTHETVEGHSFMAFAKAATKDWNWRLKAIYGQNLTEHLLLGGYAVRNVEEQTEKNSFTPTNHLFLWTEVCYEQGPTQYGIFGGYAKNFGTSHLNIGKYYAKGHDIDQLLRLTPIVSYRSGPLKLAGELEYTLAYFGTPDKDGKVIKTHTVGNIRLTAAALYIF